MRYRSAPTTGVQRNVGERPKLPDNGDRGSGVLAVAAGCDTTVNLGWLVGIRALPRRPSSLTDCTVQL